MEEAETFALEYKIQKKGDRETEAKYKVSWHGGRALHIRFREEVILSRRVTQAAAV